MQTIFGPLSKSLSIAFLISMSMSLGMEVTWRQLVSSLRDQGLVWRALAANLVLVPLLGLAIARIVPMPLDFMIAFLLAACAPGALISLRYTRNRDEDAPFAAGLTALLMLAAICFTGPITELILPAQARMNVPFDRIATVIVLFMALPALAGFAIQRWGDTSVGVKDDVILIRKIVLLSARGFFLTWAILVTFEQSRAVRQIGIRTVAAMLALILGSMIIGWLLGGPKRDNRRILATGTSMRNIALCAVISLENFPGTAVDVGIVAFSALMLTPNSILAIYENFRRKREKALAAALR